MHTPKHKELLDKANVVAVGRGPEGWVVSVTKKLPLEALDPQDVVPESYEDEPTDVVETGIIRAFATDRQRPAMGGDSIGHVDVTAGTLGLVVRDSKGLPVILSNNHVLANSNDALIGDEIVQPGVYDGGSAPRDTIATLQDFVPIAFNGIPIPSDCPVGNGVANVLNSIAAFFKRDTRLMPIIQQEGANLVDAAIARPLDSGFVADGVRLLGEVTGTDVAEVGMPLIKHGRTTDITEGSVLQTDVTVQVQYGGGKIAVFEDQLMAGAMSQPGDSGSAVLSGSNLVGLLFAGSDQTTIISRAEHVLDLLNLTV